MAARKNLQKKDKLSRFEDVIKGLPDKKQSSLPYIILSFIFLPLGLYMSSKKKMADHVFPRITMIFSLITIVTTTLIVLSILGIVSYGAGLELDKENLNFSTFVFALLSYIIAFAGVIIGYRYMQQVKNERHLSKHQKLLLLIILLLPALIQFVFSQFVALSFFNSFNKVY